MGQEREEEMITPTRISTSLPPKWVSTEYSTIDAFNCDGSMFLLVAVDHFQLYSSAAGLVKDLAIGASDEPRWSRTNPRTLYYHSGNVLIWCDVISGITVSIHAFIEYPAISGTGESDLSEDGNHMVFVGDGREVFVYQISTGTKGPVLDVTGHPLDPVMLTPDNKFVYQISTGTKGPVLDVTGHPLDSCYMTPDNNVLISWMGSGTGRFNGMELYDKNMNFIRQIANSNGHKDITRDASGKEALIWTNSNENPVTLPAFPNGIVKIDLATGQQTGLLSLPWSQGVHISCPKSAGFAIVETYAVPAAAPGQYGGEILKIPLDGSPLTELCKHGSVQVSYNSQPKATVRHDGSSVLFSSNMGQITDPNYCDVYRIDLNVPQTIEQRVADLERRVTVLEAK